MSVTNRDFYFSSIEQLSCLESLVDSLKKGCPKDASLEEKADYDDRFSSTDKKIIDLKQFLLGRFSTEKDMETLDDAWLSLKSRWELVDWSEKLIPAKDGEFRIIKDALLSIHQKCSTMRAPSPPMPIRAPSPQMPPWFRREDMIQDYFGSHMDFKSNLHDSRYYTMSDLDYYTPSSYTPSSRTTHAHTASSNTGGFELFTSQLIKLDLSILETVSKAFSHIEEGLYGDNLRKELIHGTSLIQDFSPMIAIVLVDCLQMENNLEIILKLDVFKNCKVQLKALKSALENVDDKFLEHYLLDKSNLNLFEQVCKLSIDTIIQTVLPLIKAMAEAEPA